MFDSSLTTVEMIVLIAEYYSPENHACKAVRGSVYIQFI